MPIKKGGSGRDGVCLRSAAMPTFGVTLPRISSPLRNCISCVTNVTRRQASWFPYLPRNVNFVPRLVKALGMIAGYFLHSVAMP